MSVLDNIDNLEIDFSQLDRKLFKDGRKQLKKANSDARNTKKICALTAKRLMTTKKFWFFTAVFFFVLKFKTTIEIFFSKMLVGFATAGIASQAAIISVVATSIISTTIVTDKMFIKTTPKTKELVVNNLFENPIEFVNIYKQAEEISVKNNKENEIIKELDLNPKTQEGQLIIISLFDGSKHPVTRYYQDEIDKDQMIIIGKDLQKKRVKIYEIENIKVLR